MFVEAQENGNITVEDIDLHVTEFVYYFSKIWRDCNSEFPPFEKIYSKKEKVKCENEIEKFFKTIKKDARKNGNNKMETGRIDERYSSAIRTFLRERLNFKDEQLEILFSENFLKVSGEFIKMARDFDPSLRPEEIFQACRNVWAMNWVQLLLNIPIEMTPSIFAYSMLYPYTDNYLDDTGVSFEEKNNFNQRLTERLSGKNVKPNCRNEQIIYELIGMIETQFDRLYYPKVFESLLAIHSAQIKSLLLLDSEKAIGEEDLLSISVQKGGTSVLADGYLAVGSLTEAQEKFLFGYGAYLQLVDDMQDARDDTANKFTTIFSNDAGKRTLDDLANQLYHFGEKVISGVESLDIKNLNPIIELMRRTNELLIVDAVGLAGEYYSSAYIRQIECHSPFGFSFLKKHHGSFLHSGLTFIKSSF